MNELYDMLISDSVSAKLGTLTCKLLGAYFLYYLLESLQYRLENFFLRGKHVLLNLYWIRLIPMLLKSSNMTRKKTKQE